MGLGDERTVLKTARSITLIAEIQCVNQEISDFVNLNVVHLRQIKSMPSVVKLNVSVSIIEQVLLSFLGDILHSFQVIGPQGFEHLNEHIH